ncbi:MAG: sodium-dependent transporter, partial [Muribaculaceae bacterium]|nr:sodium-dependent transporter [Muribaculaceae bacterium]
MIENRPHFATRLGVIATTVGSAVGLGNIWRFPYEAGANGGGAFLLIYIACIVVIG